MSKNHMSGEEALELVELLGRLEGISMPDLARERFDALDPIDRMVQDLANDKSVVRKLREKGGIGKLAKPYQHSPTCSGNCSERCGKNHWKAKLRKNKVRYRDVLKPRRAKEKALRLTTAEGWWKEQSLLWKQEAHKKRDTSFYPLITMEEFVGTVYPSFKGRVPIFKRLDTTKPVSLDNLYVVDVDTEKVLFDGSEYSLRRNGYIL